MTPVNPFVLGTEAAINHGHCFVEKHAIVHALAIHTSVAEGNVYKQTFPVVLSRLAYCVSCMMGGTLH
jgi:hypothetical protein